MKILISISSKFFEKQPEELIKLLKKHDSKRIIKGFEICVNFNNEEEREYMKQLCYLCKKESYIFQIHGMNLDYINQFKYMDFVNELTKILQKSIDIVIHPIVQNDIEKSIIESKEYFNRIINYIEREKYNINIGIENLNYLGIPRPNKNDILPILREINNLNFTYDMGHEIIDNRNISNLDSFTLNKINNIHIHTFKNKLDHQPIGFTNDGSKKWEECLKYLKSIKYGKSVVLEYDFYTLGDSYEERLINYIKSANIVNNYYNNCI